MPNILCNYILICFVGSGEHFSGAMAILNLVLRPFTTLLLYRILQDRNGNIGPFEGVANMFNSSQGPTGYDDMDKHQSVPTTSSQDEFYPRQL